MLRRAAMVAVGLLALVAPAVLAASPANTSMGRGRDIVQGICGQCHAVGQTDASPNPLAPHFRDLHERYPIEDLSEALGEGIIVGHPQMPELRFSEQDVAAIIVYLKSIQTSTPGPSDR